MVVLVVLLIRTVLCFAIMKEVAEIETRFELARVHIPTLAYSNYLKFYRTNVFVKCKPGGSTQNVGTVQTTNFRTTLRVVSKEEKEEPQSIAASLLAEIELKLAENAAKDATDDGDDVISAGGRGDTPSRAGSFPRGGSRGGSPRERDSGQKKGFFGMDKPAKKE